jgi:hypothetical protein
MKRSHLSRSPTTLKLTFPTTQVLYILLTVLRTVTVNALNTTHCLYFTKIKFNVSVAISVSDFRQMECT